MPSAIRRRYAVKFGIALLVIGLSIGLIGIGATAGITNEVEQRTQSDQTAFAGQEAQGLQMWNEQNEQTISTFAHSDVVASDDADAIEQRLLDWEEHLDVDTFSISYVDTSDETVLASTEDELRGESATGLETVSDDAYDQATAQVPWVSSPQVLEGELGEESSVITYVLSVPNADDRALVYTAELEAYGNQFQDDDQVATVVVDTGSNNEIILDNADYGGDYETLGQTYDGNTDLIDSALTEGASTREVSGETAGVLDTYEFDSEEYVASSARVYGTDWVVLTHEPTDQAYGFVSTISEWGYIATFIGVLMVGMVGAVLGRNTAVSIDRLTNKAGQMEDGDLDVDLETKRIDNIGRLYDGFDSMRGALREQIEEAETAREEAELERERIAEINTHLERQADEYSDVMEAAADGDLTARMDADSENEAMANIATDFNVMLEEIEQTVAELNQFATDVATASEQVTASSEEVRSASQQVSESIQEISHGAEQQNESLQSVNQEMSALSTTTEEIAASSNQVADIAERTVETGQEGQEAAQEAIAAMDDIESEAGGAVEEIQRLEDEVQQIDDLIATISEIARQTNMLALNANIEASRTVTSEDEEGFSVVATEVKALSEDVAEAADEAEDRLEAIRKRTEQSAAEVEGTSSNIDAASERVTAAVDALEEITDLAQETNIGVQEISAATEQQAASTQEVVAMVDDAATVSEETTSEAENVAAAAEEQTTALTEVTNSASNLSEQSAQLSAALDRFETDVEQAALDLDVTIEETETGLDLDGPTFDGAVDTDTDTDTTDDTPTDSITVEDEPEPEPESTAALQAETDDVGPVDTADVATGRESGSDTDEFSEHTVEQSAFDGPVFDESAVDESADPLAVDPATDRDGGPEPTAEPTDLDSAAASDEADAGDATPDPLAFETDADGAAETDSELNVGGDDVAADDPVGVDTADETPTFDDDDSERIDPLGSVEADREADEFADTKTDSADETETDDDVFTFGNAADDDAADDDDGADDA
ncbi:methyl-accepting chemotaxis sensory transducer [Natrialba taiwanensis DSM 12281]|uniref:Methyl-accepting chemotaxis sensory transducer n=1 Tax=Natrialba taiwanensis DSM 12281 TaxID=1230458 RepID=M0A7Z9_9EURY|nr:methyl-accepting chemotaxis sensory transducer [Natrialba taiwanensis DSM 12281]